MYLHKVFSVYYGIMVKVKRICRVQCCLTIRGVLLNTPRGGRIQFFYYAFYRIITMTTLTGK